LASEEDASTVLENPEVLEAVGGSPNDSAIPSTGSVLIDFPFEKDAIRELFGCTGLVCAMP